MLLALRFARPSNLMVLDEPTNDLDMETLDLLEEDVGIQIKVETHNHPTAISPFPGAATGRNNFV